MAYKYNPLVQKGFVEIPGYVPVSGSFTTTTNSINQIDSSFGSSTTLPTTAPAGTWVTYVENNNASFATNPFTITAGSGWTIAGAATFVLNTAKASITLVSNGSNRWNLTTSQTLKTDVVYVPTTSSLKTTLEEMSSLSAASKLVYRLLPGTYNLDAAVNLTPGHNINLQGSVITRTSPTASIRCKGSISGSAILLTQNLNNTNRPQTSANTPSFLTKAYLASVTGLVAGDWVMIYSNATVSSSSADGVPGKRGSLRKILQVDADGIVIKPIYWDAITTDSASVIKINMAAGGKILGGEFKDDPSVLTSANKPPILSFAYLINQSNSDQYGHDIGGKFQDYASCIKPSAKNQLIENLSDDEPGGLFGYGCSFSGATLQGRFRNSVIVKVRHGFTTDRPFIGDVLDTVGQPEQWVVSGCDVSNCTDTGIDAHKEGWMGLISNNTIRDGANGISVRSPRTKIIGNTITGSSGYGIWVTSWAPSCEVQSNTISNSIIDVVKSFGGINMQINGANTTVYSNTMRTAQSSDLAIVNSTHNCVVKDNIISSDAGITIGGSCQNTVLEGNISYQTTTTGTFIQENTNATGTRLINNISYSTSSSIYLLNGINSTRYVLNCNGLPDQISSFTTALKPDPTKFTGGHIFNSTTLKVEISDGVNWYRVVTTNVYTKNGHGFTVGQIVRTNATNYQLAQANSAANASGIIGVVETVPSVNTFTVVPVTDITSSGYLGLGTHYLSAATAGALTLTAPSNPNYVVPIGVGVDGSRLQIGTFNGVIGV